MPDFELIGSIAYGKLASVILAAGILGGMVIDLILVIAVLMESRK